MLSGCYVGVCWYEIEIRSVSDTSTITEPIYKMSRSDLSNVSWIISDLETIINSENISEIEKDISDEAYSTLRQTFVELGILTNSSTNGAGASIKGGYSYLINVIINFEQNNFSIVVAHACSA